MVRHTVYQHLADIVELVMTLKSDSSFYYLLVGLLSRYLATSINEAQ